MLIKLLKSIFYFFLLMSMTSLEAQHVFKEGNTNSYVDGFIEFNNKLYFEYDDSANGRELWMFDGINASMVADINSLNGGSSYPSDFTIFNGKLYFSADDGINGRELFEYDGVTSPTVIDLNPGSTTVTSTDPFFGGTITNTIINSSMPFGMFEFNGELFFSANVGSVGDELYKYDGTNFSLVSDIYPGTNTTNDFSGTTTNENSSFPEEFTIYNNKLYFSASGPAGRELYEYDGTTVSLVQDLRPGFYADFSGWGVSTTNPNPSNPSYLTVFNGLLYFSANSGNEGTELFQYDGTTISLVQDIHTGTSNFVCIGCGGPTENYNSSNPSELTIFNGKLLFRASDVNHGSELWEFDGTNLTMVSDINTKDNNSSGIWYGNVSVLSNNPSQTNTHNSLNTTTQGSEPKYFEVHDGFLYFSADDGDHGIELYKYDGTSAPCLVKDKVEGVSNFSPSYLTSYKDQLVMMGNRYGYDVNYGGNTTFYDLLAFRNLYVDKDAASGGDGKTWATAFNSIQDAIDFSKNFDEFWIADGTYLPSKDMNGNPSPSDNREKTYYTDKKVSFYGGFNGSECTFNDRDWLINKTIVSGDLDDNDTKSSDGLILSSNDISGNNAYHVFVFEGESDPYTGLDGLHITGGKADMAMNNNDKGGAVLQVVDGNLKSKTFLNKLKIVGNYATAGGAGYAALAGGTSTIDSDIDNLIFDGNTTAGKGGAVLIQNSGTSVSAKLTQCLVVNNSANEGGAIHNDNANIEVINNTWYGNSAATGNALYEGTGSTTKINNTIIWSNGSTGKAIHQVGNSVIMNNSLLQGGDSNFNTGDIFSTTGTNMDDDPKFVDVANGDFTLENCSPAIDGGLNDFIELNEDLGGNPRIYGPDATNNGGGYTVSFYNNSFVDIGAYEHDAEVNNIATLSSSYTKVERVINSYANTEFINDCSDIVATINNFSLGNQTELVTAEVWIEPSVLLGVSGKPFVTRHYEISPKLAASSASATVKLYFTQAEFDSFNAHPASTDDLPTGPTDDAGKANLRISKIGGTSSDDSGLPSTYNGTELVLDPADTDIVWNTTDNRWEVSFYTSGFSGFFVTTGTSILPVELTYFNAEKEGEVSMLTWGTASEENNRGFNIERSSDGINFETIGWVDGMGTTLVTQEYRFIDESPFIGINYYRLLQEDFDGASEYTDIKTVYFEAEFDVNVYPNPVKKGTGVNIDFNTETEQDVIINIYDAMGRMVESLNSNLQIGHNTLLIPSNNLSNGVYMVTIQHQGGNMDIKLVIVE